MKMLTPTLYAAITISIALSGAAPAIAVPFSKANAPALSSDVIQIESRGSRVQGHKRSRRYRNDGIRYGGDSAYYNNHRGFRERRRGYRQHNGWWFPPAAFLTGAIIGGAMNSDDYENPHYRWCAERYNSYRGSDNSFQPYGGGSRRSCNSPYS